MRERRKGMRASAEAVRTGMAKASGSNLKTLRIKNKRRRRIR